VKRNIVLRLLTLVLVTLFLASCSAAILSVGEEEWSIIHSGSTKDQVESYFGQPSEVKKLDPPMSIDLVRGEFDHIELLDSPAVRKNDGSEPFVTNPQLAATSQVRYSYSDRVQKNNEVGEAVALTGYSWGLSELFMVPLALKMQVDRSSQTHFVTVWYDKSNVALFYQWITIQQQ